VVPAPRMSFGDALAALRSRQKTSKGAPAYGRYVNRPLGRLFAAAAYALRLSPNQVTAISAACTFSGIAVIALVDPTPLSAVACSILLVVGYALDAADGQLARLIDGGSVAGEWLDHVVDAAKISSIHLAVLLNWHEFSDRSDALLLVPIGYQIVVSVMFFTVILNDQLRRAHRGTTDMVLAGDGRSSTGYSLAVIPTDYGLLCVVFALLASATVFDVVYTVLFAANAVFLLLALAKWFREMRAY